MRKKITTIVIILAILFSTKLSFAQGDKGPETTIRILTFNILHGATTKGDFDLDKIASVIKDANPDLVAMQEVDFKTNRAKKYDLVTELAWRTKMAPLFGIAMPYDGGGYGEGILTKMPIIASRNMPLPHAEKNEARTALQVLVKLPSGDTICFIGTHLEHQANDPDRIVQARKLNELFTNGKYPTVLVGDLNDTPESLAIKILKTKWTDSFGDKPEFTFPSDQPNRKVDYIMYHPANKWEVIENRVICDDIASDHCAVLSVLKLVK